MAFLPLLGSRAVHRINPRRARPRVCPRACTPREPPEYAAARPADSIPPLPPGSQSNNGIDAQAAPPSTETATYEVSVYHSMNDFDADEWDSLAGGGSASPFLRYHFLKSLEDSGCVSTTKGWTPRHLSVRERSSGIVVAAAPAYAKMHSMGEFVFDDVMQDASYACGIPYFPKLLLAPPFTPATGRRLLTSPEFERGPLLKVLSRALVQLCDVLGMSSVHVNFCEEDEAEALGKVGFIRRIGVQYHFANQKRSAGSARKFTCFDDYLAEFRAKRRGNIRRERRHVREQSGLRIEVVSGKDIDDTLMEEMFWIYKTTIDKMLYGRQYLNLELFRLLGKCDSFKERLCFVLARRKDNGRLVAGTFNVIGEKNNVFYGRYWGAHSEHKYLHFEACYYAAIEHVIGKQLDKMEPGAGGGDFKYMRGFEPTTTLSMHYLRDSRLASAVRAYFSMETRHIDAVVVDMQSGSAIRAKEKTSQEKTTQAE